MKLYFIGADHEVTGSCHFVQACGKNFLVDYGMEQGGSTYDNVEFPVSPGEIDFMLLTHAHIDHSGLIPLLCARGFHGPIYTSIATKDLCDIMLLDSAHIQEFEAEWRNRKAKRSGEPEYKPLYTVKDAMACQSQFVGVDYGKTITPADGIQATFTDVGHLLGSAAITVKIHEEGVEKTIVFSGDVGNTGQPIIRDPQPVHGGDYLVIESTYGDRLHDKRTAFVPALVRIFRDTFTRGGNVVIPSFAVGRTQELLYFIREIKEKNLLPEFPSFPVYVDSPLAVSATSIFEKNTYSCFDEEAMALVKQGINPLAFPGLKLSITSEDSKPINFVQGPKVIISASGMCDAGRIKHHLKHNLWKPQCTVLFVGYQANGTLGRAIVEGAQKVKIFGEDIMVGAKIEQLTGISGHADQKGLLDWVSRMDQKPSKIYVVHGEDQVTESFAALLEKTFGISSYAPYSGDSFDLASGGMLTAGSHEKHDASRKKARNNSIYQKLLEAGERLMGIIRKNQGLSNKELAKFTSQILQLCNRWDR